MLTRSGVVAAIGTALLLCAPVGAADEPYAGVEARISSPNVLVQPGRPVLIDLTLYNTTDDPVTLSVPDVEAEQAGAAMTLPLSHVFSGAGFGGLVIRGDYDRTWVDADGYHPPGSAPDVVLGAHSIVGRRLDATKYYVALRSAGTYKIVWQPYGGLLTSNELTIEVAPRKQALIVTDQGAMRVEFDYERAPNHVANFIELARDGFYNQKTFHRIEPGYFIQGGGPHGDGTGIRPDGKRLKAEFNDHPFDRGTVSMARVEGDPDSASCQFIITDTRLPDWDGRYTAFGELVGEESYQTLDKLMQTPVEWDKKLGFDRPKQKMVIRDVRIVDAPLSSQNDEYRAQTDSSRR